MNQDARTYNRLLFFAYVICSLAAIFYLPSLVPLRPTASDSYVFAYNNRVGIALLLLLIAIGTVWTKGLNLRLCTTGVSQPVSTKHLIWSLIAVLCGCLAMYALAGRFGGFGESSYEIDRVWLLTQGKAPYVDFEWPFGVSFLYRPLLLRQLLSISIAQAYYLFWVINCSLGILLLFGVVNFIDYPTNSKRAIYFLLYGAWFISIFNMGTHATLVRYMCPLFFILVVHKLSKGIDVKPRFCAALLTVVFTVILLLISPETAIAFAFACAYIFLLSVSSRRPRAIASFTGFLLALAVVFWAALKLHILDTVKASGGGADSFPVSFAPHILLFFAALFVCACYVFRRFKEQRINDNTIGLIAFSIPMTAAALGRCDPGHVFLNGIGIFLASMFYVSNHRTAWKWYRAAFVIVLIILPAFTGTLLYLSYARRESNIHSGTPKTVDFSHIYPSWHGAFLAPFGYKPNGLGTYLSNQVDYGHFEGLENANTEDAVHVKLTEIKNHPEKALLLPDHFDSSCHVNIPLERLVISILFAFPYFGKAVHPESVRQPICNYILAQYRLEQTPTLQNFSYGLWIAKPVGSSDPKKRRR